MMSCARKAHLFGQNPISPGTDLDFAFESVRLTFLVEGHHNNRGSVTPDQARLIVKLASPSFRLIEFTIPFP